MTEIYLIEYKPNRFAFYDNDKEGGLIENLPDMVVEEAMK